MIIINTMKSYIKFSDYLYFLLIGEIFIHVMGAHASSDDLLRYLGKIRFIGIFNFLKTLAPKGFNQKQKNYINI